jgi:epoxide hydrolase-like predicted phosphatase
MNETEAILFDFMGVLLFKRDGYVPDELVDKIDYLIGQVINDSQFKEEVKSNFNLNENQFSDILDKIINKYEKFEPLWKLLPDLKKKYKLAIINNGTALTLPVVKIRHEIDKNFDLFISSAIEGVRKPDSKIFLLTTSRLNVLPEKCLFMDDSFINIEGAKSLGMKTIWWESREKGFEKFKELLNL